MEKKISIKNVEKLFKARGYTIRTSYSYGRDIKFFDLGHLCVYISSRCRVSGRTQLQYEQQVLRSEDADEFDQRYFDELERIVDREKQIDDCILCHENYIFIHSRRTKWKMVKSSPLQIKICVDFLQFKRDAAIFVKKKTTDIHHHMVCTIPVPPALECRKEEYLAYIGKVKDEMKKVSDYLLECIEDIKDLREESRENTKYMSVDIEVAHLIAQADKQIKKANNDYNYGKKLLKQALLKLSKFALRGEIASHRLRRGHTSAARAQQTITDLR